MPKELRLPSPGRKISLDIPFHRAAKAGLIDSRSTAGSKMLGKNFAVLKIKDLAFS
jgi:hypothetical protein